MRQRPNPELEILGVVITMTTSGTRSDANSRKNPQGVRRQSIQHRIIQSVDRGEPGVPGIHFTLPDYSGAAES